MHDKFTIEELMIRILPGGSFIALLYFFLGSDMHLTLDADFDVLLTFLFLCVAFIVGELLQVLAHECEWMIDIFFRFRRPSKVFLYKNNPVLKNDYRRDDLLAFVSLSDEDRKLFDKEYSDLPLLGRGRDRKEAMLSQTVFWQLYSQVSDMEQMKVANRNYLFVRVMIIEVLIVGICLIMRQEVVLGIISVIIFFVFLWRGRGLARGLVFKTILLSISRGKHAEDRSV